MTETPQLGAEAPPAAPSMGAASGLMARFRRTHSLGRDALGVAIILLIGIPFGFLASAFALQVADTALYFVMLVLGLGLVIGMTGQLDLGHAGFFAVGAYVAAKLLIGHPALDFIFVALIAMAASATASVGVGIPVFRFRGDYLALVSLAFAEIIYSLANNLTWTGGANGLPAVPQTSVLGMSLIDQRSLYWLGFVIVAVMAAAVLLLLKSRPGRALLAIREDELAARASGINPLRYKLLSFGAAGAMAGIAGTYFVALLGFVGPESFNLTQTIIMVEMVFLGGLGSVYGSMLGALLYTGVQQVLINYVPALAGRIDLTVGAAILLLILVRPQGIAGASFVGRRA